LSGSPTAGTRPDEVRRHNRAALLRRLHVDGPCTRADLAIELGLNRSTIKTLVDGLAEDGVVAERLPARRTGAGRPSLLVLPQPHAAVVLAVDIRVEHVAVALVGIGGEILGRCSWSLRPKTRIPREVFTKIVDSSVLLIDELAVEVVAVGVSVPGVVRRSDGLVHEAPNLHWTDVPLGEWLTRALHRPVHVGNDAELGALAEHLRGAARNAADVPELGTITATRRPFVVLTSNATRELSEALRRRCLFLHIDFPEPELERRIVRLKVPGTDERLAESLVSVIGALRAMELRKAPSIAETIDWARTLLALGADTLTEDIVRTSLGVILKHQDDIVRASSQLQLDRVL
jgi:hypothetical protein